MILFSFYKNEEDLSYEEDLSQGRWEMTKLAIEMTTLLIDYVDLSYSHLNALNWRQIFI